MATLSHNRSISPDDAFGEAPPIPSDRADSRGSSVSSRLQEEYDNVLKSAVLMPNVENIPAIVEQFLGQVAREVDTYPAGHAFSSARLIDVSDDENPRSIKPTRKDNQSSNSNFLDGGGDDIVDIMGKELSTNASSASGESQEEITRKCKDVKDRSQQKLLKGFESKSSISHAYFDSNTNLQSSDATSGDADDFRNGALPKSRFIPEKEQKSLHVKSQKPVSTTKTPLIYTTKAKSNFNDVSGTSALEQLANTGGDSDLIRTENLLDQWNGELKRNILAEFGQAKCRIAGNFHHLLNKEKEKHQNELRGLREEVDSVRELLATYELSLSRKDQVISNLTQSLHRHRDRIEMQRRFAEWRQQHADKRREAFCSKLAAQHYERSLYRQIWNAWHSLLVGKWRHRVERACQAKAQEVCLQLTNDYEAKLASANEALEASRREVQRLHKEREWYEENMKKAFMRGVCALNMEALGMFRPPDDDRDVDETADATSEAEGIVANSGDPEIPSMPNFPLKQTGFSSNSAPVYTVTRENAYSSIPPLKASVSFGGRKSGTENTLPSTNQRVVRAHMIARDLTRPASQPVSSKAPEPARRAVPNSPSSKGRSLVDISDSKKVHFASKH